MLISIVIPCYNAEKFLPEALDSCFEQTYTEFEVICVDDGSTDATPRILKQYAVRHPQHIRVMTTPNRGVSHARNTGTAAATADWIQYLDADDVLLPHSLEKKAHAIMKNPEAGVIYSDWQKLKLEHSKFHRAETMHQRIENMSKDPEIGIFRGFWAPTSAYLYRKSLIEKIGGWNLNLPVIQDARFVFDCAVQKAAFVHVPEVLCLFRTGHENTLSSRKQAFAKDCLKNADDVHALWQGRGKISKEQLDALLEIYLYVARSSRNCDQVVFGEAVRRLKALDRDFVRLAPPFLRWTARVFGYERAEEIAEKWRGAKSFLGVK